jgi:YVTN family beta-propeller protein
MVTSEVHCARLCAVLAAILFWGGQTIAIAAEIDRSPVDLVLGEDGSWLVTANQTSSTASLVRVSDGKLLDEALVGRKPAAVLIVSGGKQVLVSGSYSNELTLLEVTGDKLKSVASIRLPGEPHGLALAPDGNTVYVALAAVDQVAIVDMAARKETGRIDVGRWPRYLAVSPDGKRLAVGTSGDRGISLVDLEAKKLVSIERFVGLNIGHMQTASDGHVYFPWIVYRRNPITAGNIRLGWVLASRLGRQPLDGATRREAISLDPQGKAVADPHGLALTHDQQRIVVSASGSQELLVYKREGLPFLDRGGPDHIDPKLLADKERFFRIELGGRPMGLRIAKDDRTVYVANYLDNSVQVVDLAERTVTRTISLGSASEVTLARKGEAIFYDGKRSLDQWYSCHSCHYEGGGNAVPIDTLNDGSAVTFKTVLPLFDVDKTAPWTWHGWQTDLQKAMHKSLTDTMLGRQPTADDVEAMIAYLKTLQRAPNPYRGEEGAFTAAAERGKKVFESETASCTSCHSGPLFSDGEIHDVGLGKPNDRYRGFNTPSLLGVYRKVELLHDGRAATLEELLTGPHNPAKVAGKGDLTDDQRRDLIEYLKSL